MHIDDDRFVVEVSSSLLQETGSTGSSKIGTILGWGMAAIYIGGRLPQICLNVQAIGLQVLKSIVQRGNNSESNSFLLFFNGELLRDIFTIIDKMLKKPINTEAVAIASECLRILVILQTLSKASACQKGLMNLLLEAIVMVFSASDDDLSQELNDLRSTAGKLVSQLAQIPSSVVLLKDVLLAMPVSNRLQLQDIAGTLATEEAEDSAQVAELRSSLESVDHKKRKDDVLIAGFGRKGHAVGRYSWCQIQGREGIWCLPSGSLQGEEREAKVLVLCTEIVYFCLLVVLLEVLE